MNVDDSAPFGTLCEIIIINSSSFLEAWALINCCDTKENHYSSMLCIIVDQAFAEVPMHDRHTSGSGGAANPYKKAKYICRKKDLL